MNPRALQSTASAAVRSATCTTTSRSTSTTTRATAAATAGATARQKAVASRKALFSTSVPRLGGGGGPHYDPPTGWLWGIKPGDKPPKEGWELPFFSLYCGSILLFAVAYMFKPDRSIQAWALEEARRRLEKEGILEDPNPTWVEPENRPVAKAKQALQGILKKD